MTIRFAYLFFVIFLAGVLVSVELDQAWAVVPPSAPSDTKDKEQTQLKQQQLVEMIEQLKEREWKNIETLEAIKTELIKLKEEWYAP